MNTLQRFRPMVFSDPEAPPPMTPAERSAMKALLDQIWASQLQMAADVAVLATQGDQTAERVRKLDAKIEATGAKLETQIKAVVTEAAAQREADSPALRWAKWQRTIVFWFSSAAALSAVGWATNKWLDWVSALGLRK